MGGVGMGGRPLAAASAGFLAGAFFGTFWGLAVVPLALWRPARFVVLGLLIGSLRGMLQETPRTIALAEEFEAQVVSAGVVRASGALLSLRMRGLEVHRGDRVRIYGQVHEPPPPLNPGGRDRRAELRARGIALEGSGEVIAVLERGPRIWRLIDGVRSRFAARAALLLPPERAGLVTALAVGDRSALPGDVEEDLARSGLVHLLASSGLHLAVAVLLVSGLARRLWLRTRWAGRVRASLMGAAVAVPFAMVEVLLLGAPWPAMRAGIGAALGLAGAALARRRDGPTTLLLAAAGCGLVDPAATHDLALQLSVAGIGGLLVLARPVRDLLPVPFPAAGAGWPRRFPEHLLMLGCSTAAASLCTAPLLAAAFHRVSLISAVANALGLLPGLAAIPVATLLVPFDWVPLWWLADLLAGATVSAAHLFAAVPFATMALAAPGALACALWYAGVIFVARRSLRRALVPWSALALLGFAHLPETTLRITFLAVGQGDSAIVQFPGGGAMLIDAGGDLSWPGKFDPGARDVVPALAELGVRRLDVVVLTHPHPDHAGGMLSVLDRVAVGEVWMSAEEDPIAAAVRARAREGGVPVREPHPASFGSVKVEIPSHFEEGRSLNDNSIVLRIVHGQTAVLFAGDVEALAEADLAQGPAALRAQLLKAPHHGSRTSSTDAFLRRIQPESTVFSVGARNRFGFPNPEVVARTPGRHFSTAGGAVLAESDGQSLRVHPF